MKVTRSLCVVVAIAVVGGPSFAQAPPAQRPTTVAAAPLVAPQPTHDQICEALDRRYERLYAEAERTQAPKRSFLGGMAAGLGSAAIGGLVATAGVGAIGRVAMAGGGAVATQMTAAAVGATADAANGSLLGGDDPMEGVNHAVGAMSLVQAMSRVNTQAIEQDCAAPAARYSQPRRRGLLGQLVR